HEPLRAAAAASEPGKSAREPPAAQEGAKLILDEGRQTLAIAKPPGGRTEGLPVFLHDPVQQAVAGTTRCVGYRAAGHARPTGRAACPITDGSIRRESTRARSDPSISATIIPGADRRNPH